jgi:hypothetical protein
LLGHYLAASPDSIARVEGAQAEGRPGFIELWHALEDARLENRMVERWPGMDRAFAEALPAQHGARRWDRLPPARQVDWGIYLAGRGISPGVFSIAVQDALDASADEIRRGAGGRTPEDSLQATHAIYPRVRHLLRGETGPGGHRRAQEPTSEHERGDPPRRHEVPEIALPGLVLAGDHPRRRSLPEWYRPGSLPWFEVGLGDKEVHPSARRSDHQTIVPPPAGDAETYHSLWREVQAEVGSALSRFLRVHRESTYLRFAGRYRSGRLGQNKLWRQRLADYRLFARREGGGRRRMAAVLLVDESASMQSEDKIRTATKAAILAGECLHRLDIPFEIIGFTTASFEAREAMRLGLTPARDYRTLRCSPLEHRIYKSLADSYRRVRARLSGLRPRHNNWDEEHLLFAQRRLLARPEPGRLVLVVSDGQPNGDAGHMIRAVAAASRQGWAVIGVGVGQDFAGRIYPTAVSGEDFRGIGEGLLHVLAAHLGGTRPLPFRRDRTVAASGVGPW